MPFGDPGSPSSNVTVPRRAYTILEVVMVLVVMSAIAAVTIPALLDSGERADALAVRPTLATAQVEMRRILDGSGNIPADVAAAMQLPGLSVTNTVSTSGSTISVSAAGPRTAVYAVVNGESCTVLVDRLDAGEGWATAPLATHACTAADFVDAVDLITGTPADPTEIS